MWSTDRAYASRLVAEEALALHPLQVRPPKVLFFFFASSAPKFEKGGC